MKTFSRISALLLLFLGSLIVLSILANVPATTPPYSIQDGVNRNEAKRIFEVALELIAERQGSRDFKNSRFKVSRFEDQWVVCHSIWPPVPGGDSSYFFDSEGQLLEVGGGI